MRPPQLATALWAAMCAGCMLPGHAQRTESRPPTDSSAQASPVAPPPHAPVDDASSQASPVSNGTMRGLRLAPHTAVPVRLAQAIDSGRLKNGQNVPARLANAVRTADGRSLPAGTSAELTVVATVPAGKLGAAGEFSLQLVRVGQASVDTDIQTFRGKPGHKDLPDSTPAVGTDAGLPSGAALTFHVQPLPGPIEGPPRQTAQTPGSVNGTASGAPPPPGASQAGQGNGGATGTGNIPSGRTVPSITPSTNTPAPAENVGQPSVAPNQPAPPIQSSSGTTGTTQPR